MGLIQKGLFCHGDNSQESTETCTLLVGEPMTDEEENIYEQLLSEIKVIESNVGKRQVPTFETLSPPFRKKTRKDSGPIRPAWSDIFETHLLFETILVFLNFQDYEILRICSGKMRQRICVQLLDNLNNWSFTLWKLSRCSNLDPCSYLKDATSDEVSEHSLDLDRSMEYFGERELISEEQAKLDRIMTALSFKLEYFQGIMPMGAALLSRFDQLTAYWLLRYLVMKCSNIQNRPNLYLSYIGELDCRIQYKLPLLHKHLIRNDVDIGYFAMKWIMGLFSEDVDLGLLMSFWDLLCMTEFGITTCFILAILEEMSQQILENNGQDLNELLKRRLKDKLTASRGTNILKRTKQFYLTSLSW